MNGLLVNSSYNIEGTHLLFAYEFDEIEHKRQLDLLAKSVEDIIGSTICEDFNQLEATLAFYNYLSVNSTYLETGKLSKMDNAFDVLVNSRWVCRGFTSALRYLLLQAGYDEGYSIYTRTQETPDAKLSAHIWNMLYINDNWYHFDLTWENNWENKDAPDNQLYFFGLTDEERADPTFVGEYEIWYGPDIPVPECTDDSFSPLHRGERFELDLKNHAVYIMTETGKWLLWNTQDMTFTEIDGPSFSS